MTACSRFMIPAFPSKAPPELSLVFTDQPEPEMFRVARHALIVSTISMGN